MPELPDFDFDTGSSAQGNITGACRACQNNRHHECASLREERDPFPFFDSDEPPSSGWTCPCLDDAERREDHAKHGSYE